MIRICFICLGNICRSPMAEYIMKEKVKQLGLKDKFQIESRATSHEEEGNDMYPPAKKVLEEHHIPVGNHHAKRLEKDDYEMFDYFFYMEESNRKKVETILEEKGKKIYPLFPNKDIKDPWYTRDFETAYNEIEKGIEILLQKFQIKEK